MNGLNPSEAHEHDMTRVCKITSFVKRICRSLGLIFQSSLDQGISPDIWKLSNILLVQKKMVTVDTKS